MAILVQMLRFRDKTQNPRAITYLHTEHITEFCWLRDIECPVLNISY